MTVAVVVDLSVAVVEFGAVVVMLAATAVVLIAVSLMVQWFPIQPELHTQVPF